MRQNLGPADRAIRIIAGMLLISLTVVGPRTACGFIGMLPLITAFAGWCPLYAMFGVNSCPRSVKSIP